jgi:uncharacterized protein YndB with AHSA1/START domain
MTDKLERVFELRVPIDRAWRAFTEADELSAWWASRVSRFEATPGGRMDFEITGYGEHHGRVLEVQPLRFIRWEEGPGHLPGTTEVAVTFESTETGARIHIVHSGFGDSGEWIGKREAVSLGLENCIADLTLFLEHGIRFNRMFTWQWGLGAWCKNTQAGPCILRVKPGTFAARAGLEVGDIIVHLAGMPIFYLSDLWAVCRSHEVGEELPITVVRNRSLITTKAQA